MAEETEPSTRVTLKDVYGVAKATHDDVIAMKGTVNNLVKSDDDKERRLRWLERIVYGSLGLGGIGALIASAANATGS